MTIQPMTCEQQSQWFPPQFICIVRCADTGGMREVGKGVHGPHFNLRTKQDPTVSASSISDIAFYGCSEIMRTRNVKIITVYAIIFGQFAAAFYFF